MIERFSLQAEVYDIQHKYEAVRVMDVHSTRFNIAPTQNVTIVMNDRHQQRIIREGRWGLFPFWAKDAINTTAESISTKSFLLELVSRNRCIVPCSGFFGQKKLGNERDLRAMHIVSSKHKWMSIPAVYDCFKSPSGEEIRAVTFMTTSTNGSMSTWQPKMPLIIEEDGIEAWLNPNIRDFSKLRNHLVELDCHELRAYPVTNAMKNEQYDSPECIKELMIDFA